MAHEIESSAHNFLGQERINNSLSLHAYLSLRLRFFLKPTLFTSPTRNKMDSTEPEPVTVKESTSSAASSDSSVKNLQRLAVFFGLATVGLLIATIMLAMQDPATVTVEKIVEVEPNSTEDFGANPCDGKRPLLDNIACLSDIDEIFTTGEQSGANVTRGYVGKRNTTAIPITQPYREVGLCPVNVHWHIGTEHYSVGEYDETGSGPLDFHEGRQGFQCKYYNESDPKFTTPYKWEHCLGMTIGQTYEVHWPHSEAGSCNTPWQYQTPFYDGVFCTDDVITNTAQQIGVQSQTFVVVNDEDYFYPDLFTGMIVDKESDKGIDLGIYTGSTSGTQRNNYICSPFSPITWQVDRKCHMISASSFDKMCGEMKQQADNMGDDLYAHGARELVTDIHVANNQQSRRQRELERARSLLRRGKY